MKRLLRCMAAVVGLLILMGTLPPGHIIKGETFAMESNENKATENQLEEEKASGKKQKPKKSVGQEIREWVVSLAVALLIVFVVYNFLFSLIRVDGNSMNDTLKNNERLFVSVLDVRLGNIDRGDVVICHYPNRYNSYLFGLITTKTNFVKRVVAVPGDTVCRENGVTYVKYTDENGQQVVEALDPRRAGYRTGNDYGDYVLGEDEYFVVGDNRYDSHDSRDWNDTDPSQDVGPITGDMITGHVRYVFWPIGSARAVE